MNGDFGKGEARYGERPHGYARPLCVWQSIAGTRELTDVINLAIRLSAHERKSLGEMVRDRFGRPGLRTLGMGRFFCSQFLPACGFGCCRFVTATSVAAIHTSAENTMRSPLPIAISERIQNKTSWVMGKVGFSDGCYMARHSAIFISRREVRRQGLFDHDRFSFRMLAVGAPAGNAIPCNVMFLHFDIIGLIRSR